MNPAYGVILWITIGALAGWIGSKMMGTDDRQGALANVLIGLSGALVGGFITRVLFGDNPGNNGFFTSLGVALLGSCILIGIGKVFFKRLR